MSETVKSLKIERLNKKIENHKQQYKSVSDQILRTLNEAEKITLEENLTQIEQKIAHLEEERTQLESDDSTPRQPDMQKPTVTPKKTRRSLVRCI